MKTVKLINVPRNESDMQIYIQSFCESWIKNGGKHLPQNECLKKKWIKNIVKTIAYTGIRYENDIDAYLVCSRGKHILKSSLPYNFRGEIIPMLWDCWPDTWEELSKCLRILNCRICFVTASFVAEYFSRKLPHIHFIHIPEGVDMNDYKPGKNLSEREIDVYELGRKFSDYHQQLIEDKFEEKYNFIYCDKVSKGPNFIFDSWKKFCDGLSNSKITISFPSSMTNPINASVETLTMRYWEAMLSRCLIVGHSPKELNDILGYNPVIEADLNNPCGQLEEILQHIDSYQILVDKNYEAAWKYASWDVRMEKVFLTLKEYGYSI